MRRDRRPLSRLGGRFFAVSQLRVMFVVAVAPSAAPTPALAPPNVTRPVTLEDAQPGAKKITWTAQPTYRTDAHLRRSGLIGPVELLEESGANQVCLSRDPAAAMTRLKVTTTVFRGSRIQRHQWRLHPASAPRGAPGLMRSAVAPLA